MTNYFLYSFNKVTSTFTYEGFIQHRSYMAVANLVRADLVQHTEKLWNHGKFNFGATKVQAWS